jgi:hydrogenase maturation protein HypF
MYRLTIKGIVQGVGFRPFVYRLAKSMDLRGYVRNTGDGTVEVVIDRDVKEFVSRLKAEKPPIALVESVRVEEVKGEARDFVIERSGGKSEELSLPPPDVATCNACLKELFNPADRRCMYSFISCTDCGARFTVAVKLPYDRENTTFTDFPLCNECSKEYWNVEDRRYYAQSIACPKCGPEYELVVRNKKIFGLEGIKEAAKLVDSGKIVAVKGLGGYHIACLTDDEVVWKLRNLLKRPQQPFAVMARDVEAVKRVVRMDKEEREMLSYIRPIVVLRKKRPKEFFAVAPKLDTIGLMLPYAPVHHILFHFLKASFIVMTSANLPGEPMHIDDRVFDLPLDAVLKHNLTIQNRVDDSVIKFVGGRRMIIRRSRGFVPKAFSLDSKLNLVALGAELYNSLALLKDGKAVLSQYIGNTANFKTYNEFFKKAIGFFTSFLSMDKIDLVVCDAHPLYNTSIFAERFVKERKAKLFRLQHHFAHAMSVMAEKEISKAVAITVDGVGYGFDGSVWGGEVLLIDFENQEFRRIGRLESLMLLGGDLAARYPLRPLFSIVYGKMKDYEILESYEGYLREGESFELFAEQIDKRIAIPAATSAGRVLDATSAMLELCFERTYEGEPAMKLEAAVKESEPYYNPKIDSLREESVYPAPYVTGLAARRGDVRVLNTSHVVCDALERYRSGEDRGCIAYQIIDYLARGLAEIAAGEAEDYVVMSGGVTFNSYLTPLVEKYLEEREIKLYVNEEVAAGDNGISLGQLYLGKYLDGN